MQIRMLKQGEGLYAGYAAGKVVQLHDTEAERLIADKFAEPVDAEHHAKPARKSRKSGAASPADETS